MNTGSRIERQMLGTDIAVLPDRASKVLSDKSAVRWRHDADGRVVLNAVRIADYLTCTEPPRFGRAIALWELNSDRLRYYISGGVKLSCAIADCPAKRYHFGHTAA